MRACFAWLMPCAIFFAACGGENASDGSGGNAGSGGSAGNAGSAGAAGTGGSGAMRGLGVFDRTVLHTEFYSEGAGYGDFDRDGAIDVVAGPYWYAGPGFTTRHQIYPPPVPPFDPLGYSNNFFAWTRDLNGDGWLDVLVVGFPGQDARWYENPKAPDVDWPVHAVFNGVANESPAYEDLTGDGRPELVFASAGRLGWAEPAADPNALWTFHPLSPDLGLVNFTHGLGVGDIDADGKLDVLDAGGWWQQPASLAGDPLWTRTAQAFGTGGAQMYAFDVDGDGDSDVVTTLAAHGYGISWFEQTPTGFSEHVIAPSDPASLEGPIIHEPHALGIADVNGDGLTDLVGGERFWGHVPPDPNFSDPATLYWFELQRGSGGAQFVPHLIDDASGVGTQVTPGDVSGDGVVDVVVASKKGAFVFVQQSEPINR